MNRIVATSLVFALFANPLKHHCEAQISDNPARNINRWLQHAAEAAEECDDETHDLLIGGLAEAYALTGNIARCNDLLDSLKNAGRFGECPGSVIAYSVALRGNWEAAMEIASKHKSELHRDQCHRRIGKALSEMHKFAEAQSLVARVNDSWQRNWLLGDIAKSFADAGKYKEAEAMLDRVEPSSWWGSNFPELSVNLRDQNDLEPIPVDEDPEMAAAIEQARRHVSHFVDALTNPGSSKRFFSARVLVADGDEVEHLWLVPVQYRDGKFTGRINSDPKKLDSIHFKDEITIEIDKVSDWYYWEGNRSLGHFTQNVEHYKEWLRDVRKSVQQLEADKKTNTPTTPVVDVASEYRELAFQFSSGISIDDLQSAESLAAAIDDPEKRANFWLRVAWHLLENSNPAAARKALQESVSESQKIAEPLSRSLNLILAADAYIEIGDLEIAKTLVEQSKSTEEQIVPLLRGFTDFLTGPLMVGVLIRAGDVELVFTTLRSAGGGETASAWIAFGGFCAAYEHLDFVQANYEILPTSAAKGYVALGVVKGLMSSGE